MTLRRALDILLNIIIYAIIFLLVSKLFKSFVIDDKHLFLYSFVSSVVIYLLNIFVKPLLVKLTLPITALSLGIFYFINNVIILKLADFIMGPRVDFKNLLVLYVIAVILSLCNVLIKFLFLNRIKGDKYE